MSTNSSMNSYEKAQATIGCLALTLWLGGVGIMLTVAYLVIRALLKYIGSE
jgi:hypothetical protein